MSRSHPSRSRALLPVLILVLLLALGLVAARILLRPAVDPDTALASLLLQAQQRQAASLRGDKLLGDDAADCFSLQSEGETVWHFRSAEAAVRVTRLNVEALTADLSPEMQPLAEAAVAAARVRSQVYAEDGSYLPSVARAAYETAVRARLSHREDYLESFTVPLSLKYTGGAWQPVDPAALDGLLPALPDAPGYLEAAAALTPVPFHYTLPDRTSPGPVPDAACFGFLEDPAALAAVLARPEAQRLIGGQTLDFAPENVLPGRGVHYYLDETILAIVWQQDEHGAVGTFAEVFLADASQLRRKLAGDTFGSFDYAYASQLSAQANAVVACSGDFYNSGRPTYGLCVYDGQLLRSCLTDGQTCFFTDEGDMLFAYENDFSSEQEAQHWLDEHRVMFSLAFGPVMVDNGRDVTPYSYALGEVLDTYARCAIGQLGKLHYLSMTINCESPDHYVYVTLRQAADSMIAHGCVNAYTLDGGQTGCILIGGQLINPVQFGVERLVSDIFYFATAIPDT